VWWWVLYPIQDLELESMSAEGLEFRKGSVVDPVFLKEEEGHHQNFVMGKV
jgi:hypothetical protein